MDKKVWTHVVAPLIVGTAVLVGVAACVKYDSVQKNDYSAWVTITSPNGCRYYRGGHSEPSAPVLRSDGTPDCAKIMESEAIP